MKTITMDFETYEKELKQSKNYACQDGIDIAFGRICVFLNKNMKFLDWYLHYMDMDNKASNHWKSLLKSLGREKEWDDYITYYEKDRHEN